MADTDRVGVLARLKRGARMLRERTRHLSGSAALSAELDELRLEIDEVREDQRRVAELMEMVESLVLSSRVSVKEFEERGPSALENQ